MNGEAVYSASTTATRAVRNAKPDSSKLRQQVRPVCGPEPFSFDRRRSPMAVLNLPSLVLRGVSVLGDGQTVNLLRRDAGYAASAGAPTVRISMRHPSSGCRQAFMQPAGRPVYEDEDLVAQAVPGAGRSRSRAGVLSRRSPARSAGQAIRFGWSPAVGGPKPTAAAGLCLI